MHDWDKWEFAIPWWLFLMFLLALPLWTATGAIRRKRRMGRGVCVKCGYDLRATPGRCPECGTVVKKVVQAKC
jgi:hypothetical protein